MTISDMLIERFFHHRLIRPVLIGDNMKAIPHPDKTVLYCCDEILAICYHDGSLILNVTRPRYSGIVMKCIPPTYEYVSRGLGDVRYRLKSAAMRQIEKTVKKSTFDEFLRKNHGLLRR